MLIVNKLCLHELHAPAFLAVCQFWVSATVARIVIHGRSHTFELRWVPYTLCFSASIYANMELLKRCGVSYVTVVRATLPIGMSFLEYLFLDREFPSIQVLSILSTLALSAYGYANASVEWDLITMCYTLLYYSALSTEMIVGKKIIANVDIWTATYYNNLGAIVPMVIVLFATNEHLVLQHADPTPYAVELLLLSCALGVSISASGWQVRDELSATAYTVIGIVNKFVSIVTSAQLWPESNSHIEYLFIGICILSSASYRDMPRKVAMANAFQHLTCTTPIETP